MELPLHVNTHQPFTFRVLSPSSQLSSLSIGKISINEATHIPNKPLDNCSVDCRKSIIGATALRGIGTDLSYKTETYIYMYRDHKHSYNGTHIYNNSNSAIIMRRQTVWHSGQCYDCSNCIFNSLQQPIPLASTTKLTT